MKVLVTGGSGFIGSNLIERLVERDHDVYSMLRYTTGRYVLGARDKVKVVYADLREPFRVKEVIRNIQPEVVFHLGAVSAQSYSYAHAHEVLETNFLGTVTLAEACYKMVPDFQHFIMACSAEEYGVQPYGVPIREEAPLNPHSPYAVSKVCCDYYLNYMWKAYQFPVTVMRGFNTYGRKDNSHFVVERIISQMVAGDDPVCLGDPEPVISWMYVDDHVDGYLAVFENREKALGETFNLSAREGFSVKQVAEKCAELTEYKGEVLWNMIPERPIRVMWLVGDSSKAERLLGWKAKTSPHEGLRRTVEFWKEKKGS